MLRNSIVCAVGLMVCATVSRPAQQGPTIGVSIVAASQPDAPLRVDGFEPTSSLPFRPRVRVKNVTDKAISEFEIAATVTTNCSVRADLPMMQAGLRIEPTAVEPHSTTMSDENVAVDLLIAGARAHDPNAVYFHFQYGVVEVKFADGTVWKNRFPDDSGFFDPSLMQSEARRCADWPRAASSIAIEHFTVPSAGDPSNVSMEKRAKGYFITCAIKGTTAYCPTY